MNQTGDSLEDFYSSIVLVMTSISLIASLVFCWSFIKEKHKTRGLYTILILNIYDMISPTMTLFVFLIKNDTTHSIFSYTELVSSQFTLFWSAALALFTSLILNHKIVVDLKFWMMPTLVICLLLVIPFPIIVGHALWNIKLVLSSEFYSIIASFVVSENKAGFFALFYIYGMLIPTFIIVFCYARAYNALRALESSPYISSQTKPKRVLWYSAIPVFCFMPGFCIAVICFAAGITKLTIPMLLVVTIPRRSWIFLNLLAYWFLRPTAKTETVPGFDDTSLTFSMGPNNISRPMDQSF